MHYTLGLLICLIHYICLICFIGLIRLICLTCIICLISTSAIDDIITDLGDAASSSVYIDGKID